MKNEFVYWLVVQFVVVNWDVGSIFFDLFEFDFLLRMLDQVVNLVGLLQQCCVDDGLNEFGVLVVYLQKFWLLYLQFQFYC